MKGEDKVSPLPNVIEFNKQVSADAVAANATNNRAIKRIVSQSNRQLTHSGEDTDEKSETEKRERERESKRREKEKRKGWSECFTCIRIVIFLDLLGLMSMSMC